MYKRHALLVGLVPEVVVIYIYRCTTFVVTASGKCGFATGGPARNGDTVDRDFGRAERGA